MQHFLNTYSVVRNLFTEQQNKTRLNLYSVINGIIRGYTDKGNVTGSESILISHFTKGSPRGTYV